MTVQKKVLPQLILLYLIWGFNWVVMRVANDYYSPVFFVACRFIIGAAALLIVCGIRGDLIPPRKYRGWIAVTGILGMALHILLIQICTGYIGAGMSALVDYTQSVFVCILAALFLGERFTRYKAAGIGSCVAGLMILLNLDTTEHLWAVFLAVGAAFVWAVSNILIKSKLKGCDMLQYTAWQMVCSAVLLIIYLPVMAPEAMHAGLSTLADVVTGGSGSGFLAIGTMLYTGLLGSSVAFVLWNHILSNLEAGKASIAVMAVPAVGVISGVLVLHEPMSVTIALGMLLIFAGVFTVLKPEPSHL